MKYKASGILRNAAWSLEQRNTYSCLEVERLAKASGVAAPVGEGYWANPVVADYVGVYVDSDSRLSGADSFTVMVEKAAISETERQDLRVLLLLFASEVLKSEGK